MTDQKTKQKLLQPMWENFPLSENYYQYLELQKAIQFAQIWEKTELLPQLIRAVQDPASKLTAYELEYANWVLPLYTDPKAKIDLYGLSCEIRALAAKLADKEPGLGRAPGEMPQDLPEKYQGGFTKGNYWYKKRGWNRDEYVYSYTKLCALRAALRGKIHFSPNTRTKTLEGFYDFDLSGEGFSLEAQREWVDTIAGEHSFAHQKKSWPKPRDPDAVV